MPLLGDAVLAEACRAAHRWPGLTIAVNLSPVQFHDAELPGRLTAIVAREGVPPSRIELEITEDVLLAADYGTAEQLRALRRAGFRLALDNFGTGYSSLSYLTRSQVDKIKIDRSFVSRLGQSAGAIAIVQAVIAMGHALGVTIAAEGVETPEQAEFLALAGVDEVQGYLIARPDVAAAIDAMAAEAPPAPRMGAERQPKA
jgi:EAL domain-containing protein (putative c-di-GMP-specific phosphodiesterase class I)